MSKVKAKVDSNVVLLLHCSFENKAEIIKKGNDFNNLPD